MAVIRDHSAKDAARQARSLILGDMQELGARIIDEARRKAEAIVAEARLERDKLIKGAADQGKREGLARGTTEGHAAGLAKGRAEALAAVKPQCESVTAAWEAAHADFEAARKLAEEAARRDLLHLACRIAERVIKRSIEVDPSIVTDQIRAALELVLRPSGLRIAVHPDDLAIAREALPELTERLSGSSEARLVSDPRLARGSCVVRLEGEADSSCSRGEIDASIATQLDRIISALLPGEPRQAPIAAPAAAIAPAATADPVPPAPAADVPALATLPGPAGPKGLAA